MTTTSMPRSALRHRPIAPDVEEFVVLSPRASRGKQHGEPHTTGGPPSLKKRAAPGQKKQRHPLLLMGVGMIAALLLLWVSLDVMAWATALLDNLHYGYPRTTQFDHNVGHGQMSSHFVATNVNGQVYILEIPSGNPDTARMLVGPHLVGAGADLAPVMLTFIGDARHPDLLVTVRDIQVRFHNTGTSYVPGG